MTAKFSYSLHCVRRASNEKHVQLKADHRGQSLAENRMILYSLLLIILMLTRPQGLFGTENIKRKRT